VTTHTDLKSQGDGAFNPNAHYAKTVTDPAAVERDYNTALAVMAEAVKSFGAAGAPSDLAWQKRMQAGWEWLVANDWKPVETPAAPSAPPQNPVQTTP
jgi:hypothetical protein